MSHAGLPASGRVITAVVVKSGNVHVLEAVARDVSSQSLTLTWTRNADSSAAVVGPAQRVTLNYVCPDGGWRVRARVTESSPSGAVVEFTDAPTRGEQRDSIRAWVELWTAVQPATEPLGAEPQLTLQPVELSAGGIKVPTQIPAQPGDLFHVFLRVPPELATQRLLAKMIRMEDSPTLAMALQFVGITDAVQDALFEVVAQRYQDDIRAAAMAEVH